MAETLRDEGLILRVKDWQQADKYVIAYTRTQGKQRFIAYGARYPKNVNGRLLQPFARLELVLQKGQRIDRLNSCELVALPQPMDMLQMAYGAVAAELTALFTEDGEPQEELYELLEQTLNLIRQRNPRIVVLAFALKLLALTGILPQLEGCMECGKVLEPEDEAWFNKEQAGLHCKSCHSSTEELSCSGITRELWNNLLNLDMVEPAKFIVKGVALMELEKVLFSYIRFHTDKDLNSLQFLREIGQ